MISFTRGLRTLAGKLEDIFWKHFCHYKYFPVSQPRKTLLRQANVRPKNIFKVLLQKLLAESVLATLCGYVEWVNVKFLIQENTILLQTLCLLLQENELRIKAAECLEAIAGRKVNLQNYCHYNIAVIPL